MERRKSSDLPPGFRFHPTDEELIIHYLKNQAKSRQCPVSIIPEVDIYKFNPWELPEKTELGETEWYFFSPRDRKYPNGERPNRATASGYWKATGTDKAIYSGSKHVGVKKALVFYKGRPPKGAKTDWIMHEYRLQESTSSRPMRSMKLDEWVLCRIYKKKHLGRLTEAKQEKSLPTETAIPKEADNAIDQKALLRFPRPCSLAHLLEFEYMANLLIQNPFSSTGEFYNMNGDKENCIQSTEMMKFQGNQDTPFNHENFVKPIFEF